MDFSLAGSIHSPLLPIVGKMFPFPKQIGIFPKRYGYTFVNKKGNSMLRNELGILLELPSKLEEWLDDPQYHLACSCFLSIK